MAENENLASILVKSGLISIFTNSPIGYFSKFANVFWLGCTLLFCEMTSDQLTRQQLCVIYKGDILFEHQLPDFAYLERLAGWFPLDKRLLSSGCMSKSFLLDKLPGIVIFHQSSPSLIQG